MYENKLATEIIGAGIEVHRELGPGLLESAYHDCMRHELNIRGLSYESEVPVTINYKGHVVGDAYRLDLLIENKVVLEFKVLEKINPLHKAQLLTYLRLTNRKLGLLMNFNTPVLKDGIYRVVNNL